MELYFDMMLRFTELKEPLNNVLHTDKWSTKVDQIYNSEWELIERVVTVLKVYKEATLMFSKTDASISQIIPIVKLISNSMAFTRGRANQGVRTFKKNLKDTLDRRFRDKEMEKYLHATLLDLQFKKAFFQNPTKVDQAVVSSRCIDVGDSETEGPRLI